MSDRIRTGLAYLIAMGMVIAVVSAPTVAQTVDDTADEVFEVAGLNSDTVDGLDATKYTTNKVKRAGKIVATNVNGVLPSNIVKPQWRVIQNMPGGFKDGVDDVGYSSYLYPQTFSVGDDPKSISILTYAKTDAGVQLMPVNVGDEVILIEETYRRKSADDIEHWLRVKRHPSSPNATVQFKVRMRIFHEDIQPAAKSPAALRKAVRDMVDVKVVKRG